MTGAAACLAGFSGLGVIVHGSSGCFYYPASLLHRQLHGTCITGEEVVFGADEHDLPLPAVFEIVQGGDQGRRPTGPLPATLSGGDRPAIRTAGWMAEKGADGVGGVVLQKMLETAADPMGLGGGEPEDIAE